MNLKHFLKNKNKGFSLIEVIVAMLILAIITIPLLTSLSMVTKINFGNRDKQYASNVATNIMEAVKQFGIEETALQMHGKRNFKYADPDAVDGFGETRKNYSSAAADVITASTTDVPWCLAPLSATQFKFMPRTHEETYGEDYTRKYYFFINGIEEGTKKYDVSLMFDATTAEYQSDENTLNNYSLADFSSLNSTRTALIAPSGVWFTTKIVDGVAESYDISKTFESEALRVFQERYNEFVNKQLADEKQKWTDTNELMKIAVRAYITEVKNGQDVLDNYFIAGNEASTQRRRDAFAYYLREDTHYSDYVAYVTECEQNRAGCYALNYEVGLKDINAITSQEFDLLHIENQSATQRNQTFMVMTNRKTVIKIEKDGDSYVVSSSTIFTFDEGELDLLCNHLDLAPDADPAKREAAEAQLTYECKGYYENMSFAGLENIYLFQDGARNANYKSDIVYIDASSPTLGTEAIKGFDGNPAKISFYSVWQYLKVNGDEVIEDTNPAYKTPLSGNTKIQLKSSTEVQKQFTFYVGEKPEYAFEYIPLGGAADVPLIWKNTMVADLDNTDRAYTVTVNIYEAGAEKTSDNVLYSLSTVIKE